MAGENNKGNGESLDGQAKQVAAAAQDNPWIERWMRLGYAVRGFLYGMIGFLAIQLVVSGRGQITDRQGALAALAAQPFGEILLIVIAAGLLGYVIWSVVRAVLDPFNEGSDFKGIVARLASVAVGFSYGALLMPTIRLIVGPDTQAGGSQPAQQAASGVMAQPWGPWLVGLVGLAVIGVGIYQIYRGLAEKFTWFLAQSRMSADQRTWAVRMGKVGHVAMGIVLGTIGVLAVLAAVNVDASQVGGIDGALAFLIRQPYGPWILGLVALGLIAYAIYSIMGAFWFRLKGV